MIKEKREVVEIASFPSRALRNTLAFFREFQTFGHITRMLTSGWPG
jgi:hypothetical protein